MRDIVKFFKVVWKNGKDLVRDRRFRMKRGLFVIFFYISLALALTDCFGNDFSQIKEGDLIFQESTSEQAKAIQLATHSRYTHAGIILKVKGDWKVLEAVQPVKYTKLESFINRGVKRHYVVKRLSNYDQLVNESILMKIKVVGNRYLGKKYDIYFEWNDDRIYCTELIWKIYKKTLNIEIGKLEKLSSFDLSHPYVKNLMKKRYGENIPYDELVISPESMFQSNQLVTVISN